MEKHEWKNLINIYWLNKRKKKRKKLWNKNNGNKIQFHFNLKSTRMKKKNVIFTRRHVVTSTLVHLRLNGYTGGCLKFSYTRYNLLQKAHKKNIKTLLLSFMFIYKIVHNTKHIYSTIYTHTSQCWMVVRRAPSFSSSCRRKIFK